MNIIINPEFERLIPPLSADEAVQLEALLVAEGIRDALVIARYPNEDGEEIQHLADGHNRLRIAQKHGLDYRTEIKDFPGEDDVVIWMIDNQKGRRNLTDFVKLELAEVKAERLAKKGRDNMSKGGSVTKQLQGLSIIDKPSVVTPHNTQKEIAADLGWSTGKVAMGQKVMKEAPEAIKAKVRTGEMSINQAYKEVKATEKKASIKEERRILAEAGALKEIEVDFRLGDFEEVFSDLEDGSVDCIVTDPPYPYEFIEVWSKLSRFAKRVLKPNGFCVAYSGQMYLPEVMQRMSENLDYYWTFAVYHEGQTQIVNGVNLICRWKPVLIFQNGKKKIENTFQDYFISEQREKSGHDWQQSKSGVAYLIEMFTNPGDLILEPFAGSGTTMKVAQQKSRRIKGAELNEQTYNIAKAGL